MRAPLLGLMVLLGAGCVGQTGGDSVTFEAAVAGPADAVQGQPLSFSTGAYDVVLTSAHLHVGALYLDQTAPVSGQQATGCYLTGTYLAQVVWRPPTDGSGAADFDLLDPTAQPFSQAGLGITEPPALVGQVWLTGGDINTIDDPTPILTVAGTATATAGGASYPFAGVLTIGANHQPAGGASGVDPICKQRIVTPVRAALTIEKTGGLLLTVDPRLFFAGVDFSQLPADPAGGGYLFSDDPTAAGYFPTGQDLFLNLTSIGPYTFSWSGDL